MNGDLVTQFDAAAMLNHHEQTMSAVTVGVLNYTHEVPFGVLELDGSGQITTIAEKPVLQKLVSGGIYVLDPQIVRNIPKGEFFPMTQVIEESIQRNERVTSWQLDEGWVDIGRPGDLAKAQGAE
jgi:NDP-sugar pyrophosphorylase family protein